MHAIKRHFKLLPLYFSLCLMLLTALSQNSFAAETIKIDGSSTVFPISEAVAEEFQKNQPKVRVTVGLSGTGGGFKKFVVGETDISDASRPIKTEELELAKKNGIDFIELPVAYDGIAVMVNPKNDFVTSLTVAELKKLWEPQSTVKLWSDLRPNWPKRPVKLYGPGTDSGTFDYFTHAINGKEKSSRADFTASEDDNTLVQGIAGDVDGLGYFGYAYYVSNKERLKLVGVDNGKGVVYPSDTTIHDGSYAPLSRPIFIYVSKKSLARPAVADFTKFYLEQAATLSKQVGYVPLPTSTGNLVMQRFAANQLGSMFTEHGSQLHVHLDQLLQAHEMSQQNKNTKKMKK